MYFLDKKHFKNSYFNFEAYDAINNSQLYIVAYIAHECEMNMNVNSLRKRI